MKPVTRVMQRVEKKYLLTSEQYEMIMEAFSDKLKQDPYYKSTICNVYYDTPHYDLITRSIMKPAYKEKLRLRSYGTPKHNSEVFLEIKKKCKGVVNKRRIVMDYESVEEDNLQVGTSQVDKEIAYFNDFYQVEPKVYIAYDRLSYQGIEDESLRITFDFNIRSRFDHLTLKDGDEGEPLLPEGNCIMEIKVKQAYPLWLTSILSELKIYPTSFSKYGRVFSNALRRGEITCLQAY